MMRGHEIEERNETERTSQKHERLLKFDAAHSMLPKWPMLER